MNLLAADPAPRDYPVKPVPFTAVHLDDVFWAPRLETNRAVTIPHAFGQCQASGRMNNFACAAAVLRGEDIENRKPPGFPFDDTDPCKVLKGASCALAVRPDPKMSACRLAHPRFEPRLLNGVETITGNACSVSTNENGQIVKRLQDFKAIPYFIWANRGPGEMIVWIANSENRVNAP